jgi:hypothetical protein
MTSKSAERWAMIKADPGLRETWREYQHRYRTTRYATDDAFRERCLEDMRQRYKNDPAFRQRAIERARLSKIRRRRTGHSSH